MSSEPLFKIIPGSIVKGTGEGYMVCQTEPVHPHAMKLKDHKCSYVYVHRVVMENKLGRILSKKELEQVDHIDKNKHNNAPSNLALKNLGPHQHDHSKTNHFWSKSPMNKPGRKKTASEMVYSVVQRFLEML
jgi:hypothetical protein